MGMLFRVRLRAAAGNCTEQGSLAFAQWLVRLALMSYGVVACHCTIRVTSRPANRVFGLWGNIDFMQDVRLICLQPPGTADLHAAVC